MKFLPSQSPNGVISTYFDKELRFLRLLGVSLSENESAAYRIYSILVISIGMFFYGVLEGIELTKHDINDGIGIIAMYESAIIILICRIALILWNRRKIISLLIKLEQEPFLPNRERGGDTETKLNAECVYIMTVHRLLLWGTVFVICVGMSIYTITARIISSDYRGWQFPFGPLSVLNVTYSPNYEITILYQACGNMSMAPLYVTIDLLLVGVLVHIRYQFKMLQNCVRNIVEVAEKEMKTNTRTNTISASLECNGCFTDVSWKYLHKALKDAARYHSQLLDINEAVEGVFNLLLLGSLSVMIIQMCFSVYLISIGTDNKEAVIDFGIFTLVFVQSLLISYWAEQILYESQQVGQAAYESDFIGTDLRFQKCLILMMCRSQSPWKITAGKFSVISLATFAWILRTSYSVFTVIKTTNKY